MSAIANIKKAFDDLIDKIKESDAFQELKGKYEELDAKAKFTLNLSIIGGFVLISLISVFSAISSVNTLKAEIEEKEQLVRYLQDASEKLKQYKAQRDATAGSADVTSELNVFVEKVATNSGLTNDKLSISGEKAGRETKDTREVSVEAKLNQTNLKQLTRFLFTLTQQGSPRGLSISELTVDTKNDPAGYIDATVLVSTYKAK